ncbi:RNA polymerase sigma factor [Nannocystaceae bacterium ST9]
MPARIHEQSVPVGALARRELASRAVLDPEAIVRALDDDRQALQALVERLLPVVQAEVGYALLREARSESRDPWQEVRDFVQEVFLSLLADRGKVLRSWDPGRGRSFDSFMRLVARRRVAAILRSGRHGSWTDQPMAGDALDLQFADELGLARQFESSDTLERVLGRLDGRLDERSVLLFKLLYVEERSVEEVMDRADMTRDAVYAWRLRFRKLAASLAANVRNE